MTKSNPGAQARKLLEAARASLVSAEAAGLLVHERRDAALHAVGQAEATIAQAASALAGGGSEADFNLATDDATRLRARLQTFEEQVIPAAIRNAEAAALAVAEAERRVRYVDAQVFADEVAADLISDFPAMAAMFDRLKSRVALAALMIEQANADRPADTPPLDDPESRVRDQHGSDEAVVSEERVELWAYAISGRPIEGDRQANVTDHGDGTGTLVSSGTLASSGLNRELKRRTFLKKTVRTAQTWRKGYRLADVELGPLSLTDSESLAVSFDPVELS